MLRSDSVQRGDRDDQLFELFEKYNDPRPREIDSPRYDTKGLSRL